MRTANRLVTLLAATLLALAGALVASPPAQAAVGTCRASTPVSQRPTLHSGDAGSCVTVAQQALVTKGYSVGSDGIDGAFGNVTLIATTAFQRDYGLPADGIIGPLTWGKLGTGPAYNRGTGPNDTTRVIASFDDCPTSERAFLATVQAATAAGIGLVLAPTGDCLTTYASQGIDLAALARSYGHYVINHSVSHPDLTRLDYASIVRQLQAPGVVTNVGRPPYGASNTTVATAYTAVGMREWTWTVDTMDWQGKTAAEVVSYVISQSRPGATVLMHMQWNAFNPPALTQMKSGLAARGLAFCNVYRGTTPTRLPASLPCTS
jgi:peptidoglycan hydrolase-like protein with peptidoglycan-binding domain